MPESRKTRTARGVLVALWILTLLAACAGKQGEPPTAAPGPRSTATPAPSPATRVSMPCDPGGGFPQLPHPYRPFVVPFLLLFVPAELASVYFFYYGADPTHALLRGGA